MRYSVPTFSDVSKRLYCSGEIIHGLRINNYEFDINIIKIIRHKHVDSFSTYIYSINNNDNYNNINEMLYPLTHVKLKLLIDGILN